MVDQSSRDERLDSIIAKDEIHELLLRYCRGCDRVDEDELRSVFHADAECDYGPFVGNAVEFAAWATAAHRACSVTMHMIGNSLVKVSGDVAYGETYVFNRLLAKEPGPEQDSFSFGRYIDRFERRNGVWKIAHRKFLLEYSLLNTNGAAPVAEFWKMLNRGSRDRSDPSYKFLSVAS